MSLLGEPRWREEEPKPNGQAQQPKEENAHTVPPKAGELPRALTRAVARKRWRKPPAGVRKSRGKRAADMGMSENDIAGALGQTNPASSRPYTIEAAHTQGARRVFKALARKR